MLAKPSAIDPSGQPPRTFGALLEASFKLVFASWKPLFWLCFWMNLVAQLPMVWWWWRSRAVFDGNDWRTWLDSSVLTWNASDSGVTAVALLVSLLFSFAAAYRMARIAREGDPGFSASFSHAVRLFPGSLTLLVIYSGLMVLCLLPVAAALWLVPGGESLDTLMPRLLAVLFALLLVSAPLAWVSIAAVFALPAYWLDGDGIVAAQLRSFRLVRGHWVRSASVVTTTMLAWLGVISVVGMFPLALTAVVAVALDGWIALMKPGWLVWGQLLSTPLLALFTPLCFAGWLVCYEDLRLREGMGEG